MSTSRRRNVKTIDSAPKRVKSEDAFEEAVEDKVKNKNMSYEKDDFLKDKV